ncbi:MAG: hypothetical protein IJL26_08375 [Clostridia bacterium]|nr:hypothetical protein [Clostridia bacterium]
MVFLKYLQREFARIMSNRRAECTLTKEQLKEFARCILPDIVAYCESEKGKREFKEWKEKQQSDVPHDTKMAS